MHPGHLFARFQRFNFHLKHFVQIHGGAVINGSSFFTVFQNFRIHQGAGVNNDIRFADQSLSLQGNELRISGACTDKI